MNLKIALAGLLYEKSSGDRLLIECTKYLCRKKFGNDIKFSEIDFYGRKKYRNTTQIKITVLNLLMYQQKQKY